MCAIAQKYGMPSAGHLNFQAKSRIIPGLSAERAVGMSIAQSVASQ
jgi:hypothetical protein